MSKPKKEVLENCIFTTNCFKDQWRFDDVENKFTRLVEIAENLPRTKLVFKDKTYWHGVVRSRIFRFPDDLEILCLAKKKVIQIRSASRVGISDIGVNKARISYLYRQLTNEK